MEVDYMTISHHVIKYDPAAATAIPASCILSGQIAAKGFGCGALVFEVWRIRRAWHPHMIDPSGNSHKL